MDLVGRQPRHAILQGSIRSFSQSGQLPLEVIVGEHTTHLGQVTHLDVAQLLGEKVIVQFIHQLGVELLVLQHHHSFLEHHHPVGSSESVLHRREDLSGLPRLYRADVVHRKHVEGRSFCVVLDLPDQHPLLSPELLRVLDDVAPHQVQYLGYIHLNQISLGVAINKHY